MASVYAVAKQLCMSQEWHVSNLRLQKLLYISQVLSLGLRNKPLFLNDMQAWKYGPVAPGVYAMCKDFGADEIAPVAFDSVSDECSADEKQFINKISELTKNAPDWQLVGLTHRDDTAWSKTYDPLRPYKIIPQSAMKKEYDDLWSK